MSKKPISQTNNNVNDEDNKEVFDSNISVVNNTADEEINSITTSIQSSTLEIGVEKVENKEPGTINSDNKLYLFITLHELVNNSIKSTIIDVFETESNEIKLKTTYTFKYTNNIFNIKNLIGVDDENAFISKVNPYNDTNWFFTLKAEGINTYSQICNKLIQPKGTECIMFYIYHNDTKINAYYTKGSIFAYRNKGIGSTQEIRECTENKDDLAFIKEIINKKPFVFLKPAIVQEQKPVVKRAITPQKPVVKRAITPQKPVAANPMSEFYKGDQVFLTNATKYGEKYKNINFAVEPKLTTGKNQGKYPIYNKIQNIELIVSPEEITKINPQKGGKNITISPDFLFKLNNLFPDVLKPKINSTELPKQIGIIIKTLYADFSIPPNSDNATIMLYTKLYQYYDMFQTKVNVNSISELKKEIQTFKNESNITSDHLKVNKYISILNKNTNISNYDNVSFCIHFNDLELFIKYLTNEYNTETDIINLCRSIQNLQNRNINDTMQTSLDEIINGAVATNKKVYTFLKLINFEAGNTQGNIQLEIPSNERFKTTSEDDTYLNLGYIRDNNPFYSVVNGKTEQIVNNIVPHAILKNGKPSITNDLKYDDNLILGPFDKIFDEKTDNAKISEDEQIQALVNKVVAGKKVFVMGYGVSGSGKTSTLIHYNKTNTPGILMKICTQIGNQLLGNQLLGKDNSVKAKLLYAEFYQSYQLTKPTIDESKLETLFIYNGEKEQFAPANEITFKADHKYRAKDKTFDTNTSLGEVLKYLIDEDRLVKATPNNPNSSRSHFVCIIKFYENDDVMNNEGKLDEKGLTKYPKCLIIGDLAGVENKFMCDAQDTLKSFFNTKRDGTDKRFYKDEVYNNYFDVITNAPDATDSTNLIKIENTNVLNKSLFSFSNSNIQTYISNNKNNYPTMKYPHYYVQYILKLVDIDSTKLNYSIINEYDKENSNKLLEKLDSLKTTVEKKAAELNNIPESFAINSDWYNLIKIFIGTSNVKKLIENLNNEIVDRRKYTINPPLPFYTNNFKTYANNIQALLKYELIEPFVTLIRDSIEISKYMKTACEHRLVEGEYINKSLKMLRMDIYNIIAHENQGFYYTPAYKSECYEQYQPFNAPMLDDYDIHLKSDIMNYIYRNTGWVKHINDPEPDKEYESEPKEERAEGDFIRNIEICVFGVLNISRTINNPPPIQYININSLKRYLYQYKYEEFKKALNEAINPIVVNNAVTQTKSIKEVSPYSHSVLSAIQNYINTNIKPLNFVVFNYIVKLLGLIDNRNALTQVGTVEFLDKIAKLNTTVSSCEAVKVKK